MDLREDLKKLEAEARELIERVKDSAELEAARVKYLGRKEGVTQRARTHLAGA